MNVTEFVARLIVLVETIGKEEMANMPLKTRAMDLPFWEPDWYEVTGLACDGKNLIIEWKEMGGKEIYDTKEPTNCPDCAVVPGGRHIDGCDVARCTVCGGQRISCDHEESEEGWGQIWTGYWLDTNEGLK